VAVAAHSDYVFARYKYSYLRIYLLTYLFLTLLMLFYYCYYFFAPASTKPYYYYYYYYFIIIVIITTLSHDSAAYYHYQCVREFHAVALADRGGAVGAYSSRVGFNVPPNTL